MITYAPSPRFSIREASLLCGLPESTLRYYESIGLLPPVARDGSSKHRVYSEADITCAIAVSCLNATGMPLDDMRAYLKNREIGALGAREQIRLLEALQQRLVIEQHALELRRAYVEVKIAYWNAVAVDDAAQVEALHRRATPLANELKSLHKRETVLQHSLLDPELQPAEG